MIVLVSVYTSNPSITWYTPLKRGRVHAFLWVDGFHHGFITQIIVFPPQNVDILVSGINGRFLQVQSGRQLYREL